PTFRHFRRRVRDRPHMEHWTPNRRCAHPRTSKEIDIGTRAITLAKRPSIAPANTSLSDSSFTHAPKACSLVSDLVFLLRHCRLSHSIRFWHQPLIRPPLIGRPRSAAACLVRSLLARAAKSEGTAWTLPCVAVH